MSVQVSSISKTFGSFTALDEVNVDIESGELLALLGPSGSGKTTLLRIIGGLEFADPGKGRILLHGQDVTDWEVGKRQIGFVFQHYALFRHLNVFDNIAFGLAVRPRRERPSKQFISKRVAELLELIQLSDLAKRLPNQLSGGQRQRVALARALAIDPKVLLLDEPFGALDAKVRKDLRRWIRRLHDEIHVTSVFVTHDQDEALEVADRIVVMNKGRVEQIGTPNEVYDHPASPFVYNFLGRVVRLRGRLNHGAVLLGDASFDAPQHPAVANAAASVYVRPHELKLLSGPSSTPTLQASVKQINNAGALLYLELVRRDNGDSFEVEVPREHGRTAHLQPGAAVHLSLQRYSVFLDDNAEECLQQTSEPQRGAA